QSCTAVEAALIAPVQAQVADAIELLGAKESDREVRIVVPADVLFDFDKADIRPDAAAGLQQILTVVRFYETAPLRIEGHTDAMGDDAYNQTLSDRRAASVKQWLITQGQVAIDRMSTRGFGESQPAAANTKPDSSDDPAGRQLNRRVESVIEKQ
ncbi:MAG: OmpA family protein, partial [Microcoleus sp. SIO2G3]|nr:OmpA family protein [Microcoleus sp. SIO2G3]